MLRNISDGNDVRQIILQQKQAREKNYVQIFYQKKLT